MTSLQWSFFVLLAGASIALAVNIRDYRRAVRDRSGLAMMYAAMAVLWGAIIGGSLYRIMHP